MTALPPIRRLVIANRGDAAMRCIRAVKLLRAKRDGDLQVVALYTEPDRDAPFVRHADYAVRLQTTGRAVAAYLDAEVVLTATLEAGGDALWPGWGFLSEDPSFAERVIQAGIRFLGPGPAAMRALGDKVSAKKRAESVGVPVTPWSGEVVGDESAALEQAEKLGFPVVIKASAGGGGRGIRVVQRADAMSEAFRSAASEARNNFGDDRLFIEKLVRGVRHVEVQIAADLDGVVRALGCRDCSLQRRHQKVIEEAPPHGLSAARQRALEDAAVRLVEGVGYVGVGTVEFLVDTEAFYLLEVNPRLQVEHGITEEITGVDLVELQIRIAEGESLADLSIREQGVAIEARVCAEDPDQNFLPAPGRIARFDPALGSGIRIDSGVVQGSEVPPDFDSLVAKVIATGATREQARTRLCCALRDFELVIHGGATNKGYLLEILEADRYRTGAVDTAWLTRWTRHRGGARARQAASDERSRDALVAAAIFAYQRARAAARVNFYADTTNISVARIPPAQGQQIDLAHAGESYRLKVYAIGSWRYRIHLDGRVVGAEMREEGSHGARLMIDERVRRILYDATEMGLRIEIDGHPVRFDWQTAGHVRTSTPAMVVAVHVKVGDRVQAGQALGLLEAMKMEIGFQAPVAGVVTEVTVRRGQQVAAGEVLLIIDSAVRVQEASSSGLRLSLPPQRDALELLFRARDGEPLAEPDLKEADRVGREARAGAIAALREEIRRVLLGYDANPERGEKLHAFLEAPLPDGLSEDFRSELANLRSELTAFADLEQLFIRAPRASVSGELGPSNNARLRMYVRRLNAAGAGIAEEFLDLVRTALSHYAIYDLEASDALERAVLRLFSSQVAPELRFRLVLGVIRRITALAGSGIDLGHDRDLSDALNRIAHMRGLLPDALADAAIEASYVIFDGPGIERQAEQTSKRVERWLAEAEAEPTVPPAGVLLELAAAPRRVFSRVGHWIASPDAGRREIAVAAHVQRLYAPRAPFGHTSTNVEGTRIHCVEYPERGAVVAGSAGEKDVLVVARSLCLAACRLAEGSGSGSVYAVELVLVNGRREGLEELLDRIEAVVSEHRPPCRVTLAVLSESGHSHYETFHSGPDDTLQRLATYGLHPETVERIDLARLAAFELERLPSEDGIYSFYGRSRDVPGDERVFVLADVRGRSALEGNEAALHQPAFEHAFYEATRSLRGILQMRDPRRRLQWNRIALFVASEIFLDAETANDLSRRLAPLTRHLGLEKVLVRLNLLDRKAPDGPARSMEIVITDLTGSQIELAWRAPHHDPLEPAQDYERKVVDARRRRLVYPYEIIRMLTPGEVGAVGNGDGKAPLPGGRFEEYDLDPQIDRPSARSVAGRPFGQNSAAVVFGVISTPTEKVPEGMRRVLLLSDPTMGMGALSGAECDRIIAAIELAEKLGVPLEWVPVSSGAKIAMDSGTENLDATARVVRRIVTFTQAGGVIHLIVQGINVGAQSYFDALSTMLMHTRGVLIMTPGASMVLTGRAALEASGAVSAEDEEAIGGFERVMGPNGQAQYYARSLVEAYRMLYEHYRYGYVVPGESGPRRFDSQDPRDRSICDFELPSEQSFGFATVGELFDDATNPARKRPFAMRSVMAATCDQDGGHLERWRSMVGAETAIVWDAHLGGFPIVLIGIESYNVPREGYRPLDGPETWTGATLFPLSSKKVARAINSASGNRPVVVLANLSGFDGSPESLRKLQLEYGAEIARAVVNFEGPLLFVVVSRYHGGAYVVFSQELNDSLSASALAGSYASVIGGGPAAAVVFSREIRARAVGDPRVVAAEQALRAYPSTEARERLDAVLRDVVLEKQAELASEFDRVHSVERACEVGSLVGIRSPQELRPSLIAQLEAALRSPEG